MQKHVKGPRAALYPCTFLSYSPARQLMKFMKYRAIPLLLFLFARTLSAATIGTVVPVVGQVMDLVHDPNRNLVYLANSQRNQIEVYSVDTGRLTGSITVGLQPSSLAMSLDGNTLYV